MQPSRGARTAARMRRVVDVALWTFVVPVIGTILLSQLPPRLGHPVFVVGGPSMEPALPLGAVVVTAPTPERALRPGDVVTMRIGPEQAIFTHRIVRVAERDGAVWLETKGDNNAGPDPAIVPATAVIGRVEFVIPVVGFLVALLSMPSGIAFAVGVATTLYVLAWLLETFEDERRVPLREAVRSIARRTRLGPRSQVHPELIGWRRTPTGGGPRRPFGSAHG